ncbi:MAG: hypothetical protein Q8N94_08765 [Methanoregula sp.]|nr:hypothetical protein [Methanoregula sp.]
MELRAHTPGMCSAIYGYGRKNERAWRRFYIFPDTPEEIGFNRVRGISTPTSGRMNGEHLSAIQ